MRDLWSGPCASGGATGSLGMTTFFFLFKLTYLFLAALGSHCCAQAFCSCGERGLLFVVVRRLLIVVASFAAEHRL